MAPVSGKAGRHEARESPCAVADPVLLRRGPSRRRSALRHPAGTSGRSRDPRRPRIGQTQRPSTAALEDLVVTVGPGQDQRAAEPRRPRLGRAARPRAPPRSASSPGRSPGRPGPPPSRRYARPGAPPSASTSMPESSASAGSPLAAAAACALIRALPTKVSSVSSGSGKPEFARRDHLDRIGRQQCRGSPRACRALWVATTSRGPSSRRRHRDGRPLRRDELRRRPSPRGRAACSSCARLKVAPSALPCTSISPRSSVITKFASVPAALSSA